MTDQFILQSQSLSHGEAKALEHTTCPQCNNGTLTIEIVKHDPMTGNAFGLRCSKYKECSFKRLIHRMM